MVERLIAVIRENKAYLSEIDGRIGDGDHGINMDKGFQLTASRLEEGMSMSDALRVLGRTLLLEIGGSMGPLYGQFFKAMAAASKEAERVDAPVVLAMLKAAYAAIRELGGAGLGEALDAMVSAAEAGWKSTEDLLAKVGRSSRLGERSRGVLDAGATSCYLILDAMARTMKELSVKSSDQL